MEIMLHHNNDKYAIFYRSVYISNPYSPMYLYVCVCIGTLKTPCGYLNFDMEPCEIFSYACKESLWIIMPDYQSFT